MATNDAVIGAYEKRVADLQNKQRVVAERLSKMRASTERSGQPKGSAFDEKFEFAVQFLANPWKL